MEIVLVVISCAACCTLGVVFGGYHFYHKGYTVGKSEAQKLVDEDGLTKEEKEQLRQVIHVLSWGGENEN